MEFINITVNSLCVCGSYYKKIIEHLEIMNAWKLDPVIMSKYPSLGREFTLADSLQDLLMKGEL